MATSSDRPATLGTPVRAVKQHRAVPQAWLHVLSRTTGPGEVLCRILRSWQRLVFLSLTGKGPSTWDPALIFREQGCAPQPRQHIEAVHPGGMRPQQRCWSVRCGGAEQQMAFREGGCPAWDGDRRVLPCACLSPPAAPHTSGPMGQLSPTQPCSDLNSNSFIYSYLVSVLSALRRSGTQTSAEPGASLIQSTAKAFGSEKQS